MEYQTIIKEYTNGTNIVRIPILTPEQEEERHKRMEKAAQGMLQDMAKLGLLRTPEEAASVMEERKKKREEWLKTCTIITEHRED